MTPEQLAERAAWSGGTERGIVTDVSGQSIGWESEGGGRMGMALSERSEIIPAVGDHILVYGGFGYEVRGLDVNGQPSYFRTDAEVRDSHARYRNAERERKAREFAENLAKLDADYAALPENFQRRIAGFRAASPAWREEYEAYEMTACTDAVKIAAWLTAQNQLISQSYDRFCTMSWDDQKAAIPDLFDGHSGNSFGFAMRLGYWHATEPERVVQEHGALTPLVGCDAYGCKHPRDLSEPPG